MGAFRGHFGAPPASRRAVRGAFFMEILEILENYIREIDFLKEIQGPDLIKSFQRFCTNLFLYVQKKSLSYAGSRETVSEPLHDIRPVRGPGQAPRKDRVCRAEHSNTQEQSNISQSSPVYM